MKKTENVKLSKPIVNWAGIFVEITWTKTDIVEYVFSVSPLDENDIGHCSYLFNFVNIHNGVRLTKGIIISSDPNEYNTIIKNLIKSIGGYTKYRLYRKKQKIICKLKVEVKKGRGLNNCG